MLLSEEVTRAHRRGHALYYILQRFSKIWQRHSKSRCCFLTNQNSVVKRMRKDYAFNIIRVHVISQNVNAVGRSWKTAVIAS